MNEEKMPPTKFADVLNKVHLSQREFDASLIGREFVHYLYKSGGKERLVKCV